LSDAGRDQAARLAAELSGSRLTRIFSSDRVRALATAEPIAADRRLEVVVDHRLREIDFGAWEGRRLGDLWNEDPEAAAAWESDLRATPRSFGESLRDLEARVSAFRSDRPWRPEEVIAVVAHRGSLAVLRSLFTGVSLEAAFAAGMALGCATRVNPRREGTQD
jgi:broad specificity phosphatase PhoE